MKRYGAAARRTVELAPGFIVTVILIWLAPPATVAEAELQVSVGVAVSILGVMLVDGAALESLVRSYREEARLLNSMIGGQMASDSLSRTILEIGTIEIPGHEFERFYLNALWSVEHSYITTFVATDTSAGEGHNRLALEIQRTKVRVSGCDIRRFFIFADQEQFNSHQEMMKTSTAAGIRVKYIFQQAILEDRSLRSQLDRLGSLDFSIIDSDIVLQTKIATSHGRNVSIEHTQVSRNRGLADSYNFFFSLLWEYGSTLETQ